MRAIVRRAVILSLALFLLVAALFTWNGTNDGWRVPDSGTTSFPPRRGGIGEVRILAFNIAKCFAFDGSGGFAPRADVVARLDGVVEIIERERVDLAYVSEIVSECGPRPIDQVRYIAEHGHFHAWASCDNYRFGIPGFRLRSGNALFSRFPLRPIECIQLAGARPFWEPTNNRRILWCEIEIGGERLLTASLRNDSFDLDNNLTQARTILAYVGGRRALLAGDFNADTRDVPMEEFRRAGFSGELDGPPTFPTRAPDRCIDYVLAPADWELVEHRVLESTLSDHLPVLSVFRPGGREK